MRRERLLREVQLLRTMEHLPEAHCVLWETDKGQVPILPVGLEPAEGQEPRPLLIDIHGGGFVMGSCSTDVPMLRYLTETCQVGAISIEYALAPEHMFPIGLEQCRAVLDYVRAHAPALGVDPTRILLMGHSAGGNFCAGIGMLDRDSDCPLCGMVLDYPPTDLTVDPQDKPQPDGALPLQLCRLFDRAYCTEEQQPNPLVSPALATEDMVRHFPPTMLITAGRDSMAPEAQRLGLILQNADVKLTCRHYAQALHGFTVFDQVQLQANPEQAPLQMQAWQDIAKFILKNLNNI